MIDSEGKLTTLCFECKEANLSAPLGRPLRDTWPVLRVTLLYPAIMYEREQSMSRYFSLAFS